jgi:hypothetical protein
MTGVLPLAEWPALVAEVVERIGRHDVEVVTLSLESYGGPGTPDVQLYLRGGEAPVDAVAPEFCAGPDDGSPSYVRLGHLGDVRVRIVSKRTRCAPGCSCDCHGGAS